MASKKNIRKLHGLLALALSLLIALVFSELFIRAVLSSESQLLMRLRQPYLYFRDFEDDYWKLQYRIDPSFRAPYDPHPILGWLGRGLAIDESYTHKNFAQVRDRQPVLLYGDSFAACTTAEKDCFQGILNSDKEFRKKHYLLNYGVGGYGVDQTYLLLSLSLKRYDKPFVVVSLFTHDLLRSSSGFFRPGQKPRFELTPGGLKQVNQPIDRDQAHFLEENPPRVFSYLYKAYYAMIHPQIDLNTRNRILNLNGALLLKIEKELSEHEIEHVYLVFSSYDSMEAGSWPADWIERFLADFFAKNQLPYLESKSLVNRDRQKTGRPLSDYFNADDAHPSVLQNKLVSKAIKEYLFNSQGRSTLTNPLPPGGDRWATRRDCVFCFRR